MSTHSGLEISAASAQQGERDEALTKLARVPWIPILFIALTVESALFVYSFISIGNMTRLSPWNSGRDESVVNQSSARSLATGQPRRASSHDACEGTPVVAASVQCNGSGVCRVGVPPPCQSAAAGVNGGAPFASLAK